VVHRQFKHLADDVLGLLAHATQPAGPPPGLRPTISRRAA
jgi:hypothetical protein